MRRPWTPAETVLLYKMVAAREPVDMIAEVMGRTPAAISMRKSRLELSSKVRFPPAAVEAVAELYAVGTPVKDIARKLGTSPSKVVRTIRENLLVNARSYSVGSVYPGDDEIERRIDAGEALADVARSVGQFPYLVRSRMLTRARHRAIAAARAGERA